MFACHINVDICLSRERSVNYLLKYVCNWHDRLKIHFKPKNEVAYDEGKNNKDSNCIRGPEGTYRMLQFNIIYSKPTVERMEAHVVNRKVMYFDWRDEREAARTPSNGNTLNMWFSANSNFRTSKQLKYDQFPCCFRWVRYE